MNNSNGKSVNPYQMNMFLKAFSFEHDPHIIVVMCDKPFGATDINTSCNRFGQSSPGNTPSAGRFTKAKKKKKDRMNFS